MLPRGSFFVEVPSTLTAFGVREHVPPAGDKASERIAKERMRAVTMQTSDSFLTLALSKAKSGEQKAAAHSIRQRLLYLTIGAVVGAVVTLGIYEILRGSRVRAPGDSVPARPTVGLTLRGVVEPHAQAGLHATVTGTVVWVARQPSADWAAGLAVQPALLTLGGGLGEAARFAAQARILLEQAPRIDIGSAVRAGEVLVEIAAPELWLEVADREARVRELRADRERAALALAVRYRQAETRKQQAAAELQKAETEYRHAEKLLQRITELARRQAVTAELVDEHQHSLDAATAARESARAKLRAAEADLTLGLDATGELASRDAAIREAVRDLERARRRAEATLLRAPFDGVVTARTVERGDFVHGSPAVPSPALVTVARLERVVFVAHVPEANVPAVRVGDVATVAIDGHPCCLLRGRISRIGQVVEAAPGGLRVEIDLENPGGRVKPGMHGTATLTSREGSNLERAS